MPHKRGQDVTGDRDRFEHMLGAARDAIAFAHGRKRDDLDRDAMLRRGLVNCVQVIGEAAARMTTASETGTVFTIPVSRKGAWSCREQQ